MWGVDFKDDWSTTTTDLSSSLISLGVDVLLMDDANVNAEGKVKMAGAIALLVADLNMRNGVQALLEEGVTIHESRRKMKDLADSGERGVVNFFKKEVTCGCLTKKYKELKQTQEKVGRCDNCSKTLPLKQLLQCSQCKIVQVSPTYNSIYIRTYRAKRMSSKALLLHQYCSPQCQVGK